VKWPGWSNAHQHVGPTSNFFVASTKVCRRMEKRA
jgi:hypothetical protein